MNINQQLALELSIPQWKIDAAVELIDAGNTIPFISRYRKEITGSLDDGQLRALDERLSYLRGLEKRRGEILSSIDEQGKLTDELSERIELATTLAELEDLYRPYKQKRRTRASIAREKGLTELSELIFAQTSTTPLAELAKDFIDEEKGVSSADEAIAGAMDIIAENIADSADIRAAIKELIFKDAEILAKGDPEDEVYSIYADFGEKISAIAPHRILAINRGVKEGKLRSEVAVSDDKVHRILLDFVITGKGELSETVRAAALDSWKRLLQPSLLRSEVAVSDDKVHRILLDFVITGKGELSETVRAAALDSWKRLLQPSLENEVFSTLFDTAAEQAIKVFGENLYHLLMQAPLKNRVVLGLDPGYRTGCKLAVVDATGKVLDTGVIYPTPPQNKIEQAKKIVSELIRKHSVSVVSIGNGTASRESEKFIAELISELNCNVAYTVVSEAGASVYSASKLAAEEFPDYDVSLRSAVSIARRLQDPLAELVKIDPRSIGIGQYQHDMPQTRLEKALDGVVESSVNSVGVDLNTASASLLSYVAGVGKALAKNIVAYREENGSFTDRSQLTKVPKLGKKAFEQCAGFLRISDGKNKLDSTAVHPESYRATKLLLERNGYTLDDIGTAKLHELSQLKAKNSSKALEILSDELGLGVPTLCDIIDELLKPGRDPRDSVEPPILRTDVMEIKDLKNGMELTGTVRNVVDFGAFVDIGVHEDGLVHISQLSNRFIKHPSDVVKVGDIVKVTVLDVDIQRKRISLTMKGAARS